MGTDAAQPDRAPLPVVLWLARDQLETVGAAVRDAGLTVAAVGVEGEPHADVDSLPGDPERLPDLRTALATASDALLLCAAPLDGETGALLEDPRMLQGGRRRNLRVATIDPAPSAATSPSVQVRDGDAGAWPAVVPAFRETPGVRAALDAAASFGPVRTLLVAARCAPHHATLGARLLDACDAVCAWMGEPELVDAAVSAPRSATPLRQSPGEGLRGLRGDLSAMMRFADGGSAVVAISDRAGGWFRGCTVLGDGGAMRVDEAGFEWVSPSGELIERSGADRAHTDPLASALRSLASEPPPTGAPSLRLRALVVAQAATLSARTGQPESPATIRRMASLTP